MFDDERHYNLIWTGAFIKFSKQNTLEILALAVADLIPGPEFNNRLVSARKVKLHFCSLPIFIFLFACFLLSKFSVSYREKSLTEVRVQLDTTYEVRFFSV